MNARTEQVVTSPEVGPILVGHVAGSQQFHAAFEEEYRLHRLGRGTWLRYIAVGLVSSLLTFGITWGFASSRPVTVRLATASDIQAAAAASNSNATGDAAANTSSTTGVLNKVTTKVAATAANTGQVALTETQLRAAVRNIGSSIYWAGSLQNAKYTYNHIGTGQDFVRYLPNGKGLNDVTQNYRVIATYQDPNAFDTVVAASKLTPGVTKTNPDGSFLFYATASPNHVYLVYQNLPYQIEIFDPIPGAALKMATTPGIISAIF